MIKMRLSIAFLLILLSLSFAQYYQVSIVRANDTQRMNLTYDINSTSYKDNSITNPDALLRICGTSSSDLLNKYVILAYADGTNTAGQYIQITHYAVQITEVPPNLCVNVPLEISSFKAWYPSIPFVLIGDNPTDFSSATRWKLSRHRGWLMGNYSVNESRVGDDVNVTVLNATDYNGNLIIPTVTFLVVGLVKEDGLTTTSTAIVKPGENAQLSLNGYTGNYSILVNGIGPIKDDTLAPYVKIYSPGNGATYRLSESIPLNFLITDNDEVASCWYVLDSNTYTLPSCDTSYVLPSLGAGSHTLTLYAQDLDGNIGSDSVTFRVLGGSGGDYWWMGGMARNITNQTTPTTPTSQDFMIVPESIYMWNDYPNGGKVSFTVHSNFPLTDVVCKINTQFKYWNITSIVLNGSTVSPNSPLTGVITVDMGPELALKSDGPTQGFIECRGKYNETVVLATSANIYFTVRKPKLTLIDTMESVYPGEKFKGMLTIVNNGTADSADTLVVVRDPYKGWVYLYKLPKSVPADGFENFDFMLQVPYGNEEGTYTILLDVYEYGVHVSTGKILVNVKKKPSEITPICTQEFGPCWLLLALILSLITALLTYKWGKGQKMENKKSLLYSVLSFFITLTLIYIAVMAFAPSCHPDYCIYWMPLALILSIVMGVVVGEWKKKTHKSLIYGIVAVFATFMLCYQLMLWFAPTCVPSYCSYWMPLSIITSSLASALVYLLTENKVAKSKSYAYSLAAFLITEVISSTAIFWFAPTCILQYETYLAPAIAIALLIIGLIVYLWKKGNADSK